MHKTCEPCSDINENFVELLASLQEKDKQILMVKYGMFAVVKVAANLFNPYIFTCIVSFSFKLNIFILLVHSVGPL